MLDPELSKTLILLSGIYYKAHGHDHQNGLRVGFQNLKREMVRLGHPRVS